MTVTMQGLTRSLADYLAPALPSVTFYDNPNQQGTKLPALFLQRTKAKITKKLGGRFATTKGSGHGFGLKRIDEIVERHGGWVDRNSEDGAFTTEILLPQ